MQGLIVLVVVIVIISAVVGAIAQFLNKVSEAAAPPPRRPVAPGTLSPTVRAEELPVATVVTSNAMTAGALTGAPVAQVTRLPVRARPTPKTEFARSLTGLLCSGQGPAMAVVLQEVLGPPKC